MKNGDMVVIRPTYEPLPEKKEVMTKLELEQYITKRANDKGKNVAAFYDALFDVIRTDPTWRGDRVQISDPSYYGMKQDNGFGFNPDSLKVYRSGPVYGEVKVSAFRNAKFWCSPKQFLKYWAQLEDMNEMGEKMPFLNYGLFRYGSRDDYKIHECEYSGKTKNKSKHICDNKCLTSNLATKTRELTIIPINLMLALFMSNKFRKNGKMDQSSSRISLENQDYFWLKGTLASTLHNNNGSTVKSVEELIDGSVSPATYDLLGLKDINISRERSNGVYCLPVGMNGFHYKVKEFPIVRLEMSKESEKKWAENFRDYGRDILRYCFGIQNLEDAIKELPFGDEEIITENGEIPF